MYLIVEWLIVTNWIICYRTTPGIHVTSYFTLKYCPNEIPPSSAIANKMRSLKITPKSSIAKTPNINFELFHQSCSFEEIVKGL